MHIRKAILFSMIMAGSILLVACGKKTKNTDFADQLNDFTVAINKLDDKINSMDTTLSDYDKRLLNNLDEVADVFSGLPELKTDEYEYYDELADGANYYMKQANKYFHLAFGEDGYNPTFGEQAVNYYNRAIQYVRYIGYMINDYDVSDVAIPLDQLIEQDR